MAPLRVNPEQIPAFMPGSRRADFAYISRKFLSGPRLFSELEYIYFMKIGQTKLSERKESKKPAVCYKQ